MAELHEADHIPPPTEGFVPASRLLACVPEGDNVSTEFKFCKAEPLKMDLNGGIGCKHAQASESSPEISLKDANALGSMPEPISSQVQRADVPDLPDSPSSPKYGCRGLVQHLSDTGPRSNKQAYIATAAKSQRPRPALSPSQASALKIVPKRELDLYGRPLVSDIPSQDFDASREIPSHCHSSTSPLNPPLQVSHSPLPAKPSSYHHTEMPKNSYDETNSPQTGHSPRVNTTGCSLHDSLPRNTVSQSAAIDLTADEDYPVASCRINSTTKETSSAPGAGDLQARIKSIAPKQPKSSSTLQTPKVLGPRKTVDRVQKRPTSPRSIKPAVQASNNRAQYHTSDIVKLLAKKLEEEQEDAATAAELASEKQKREIQHLNQLLKERTLCLQTTESQLSDLQEDATSKAEGFRKIQEKAAKFSKFMASIGSEMAILKSDHQELRRDHAKLRLYADDLENRSKKLQNETGNYQAAFRKYRSEMQEEMTDAGGQLKLLSLRHDDLEQQRDSNVALLAEERDRSTNLAQQLSKANDRLDLLHSCLDGSKDAILNHLALLQASVDKSQDQEASSSELDRALVLIGSLLDHKEHAISELQSVKVGFAAAAETISSRLHHIDERQKNQIAQMAAFSAASEQRLASLRGDFKEQQQFKTSQHRLELINLSLTKQLESKESMLAECDQQRCDLRASEKRLNDHIVHLRAEVQTMKEQHMADAQLACQVQRREVECTELRAKLTAAEHSLTLVQQDHNKMQDSTNNLQLELSSTKSRLEFSEDRSRGLAERCKDLVHSAHSELTEARRQWHNTSQEESLKKQVEHDNFLKQSTEERAQLQNTLQQHMIEMTALTVERDNLVADLTRRKASLKYLQEQLKTLEQFTENVKADMESAESAKQRAQSDLAECVRRTEMANAETKQQHQSDLQMLQNKLNESEHVLVQATEKLGVTLRSHSEVLSNSQSADEERLCNPTNDHEIARSTSKARDDALETIHAQVQNLVEKLKKSEEIRTILLQQVDVQAQDLTSLAAQTKHSSFAQQNVHTQGTQTRVTPHPADPCRFKPMENLPRITREMVNRPDGAVNVVDLNDVHLSEGVQATGVSTRNEQGPALPAFQEFGVDVQFSRPQDGDQQLTTDTFAGLEVVNPGMLSMVGYTEGQTFLQNNEDMTFAKETGLEGSTLSVVTPTTPKHMPSENQPSSSSLSKISSQTPMASVGGPALSVIVPNNPTTISTRKVGSLKRPALAKNIDLEPVQTSSHFMDRHPSKLSMMTLSQDSQADDLNIVEDGSGFGVPNADRKPKNKYTMDHDNHRTRRNSHESEQHGSLVPVKPRKSSLKRQSATHSATATPRQTKRQKQVSHADAPLVHASRPISSGSQGSSQHSVTETHSVSITTSSRVRSFTSPNARQPPARASNQRRGKAVTGVGTGRKATRASAPFT